MGHPVYMYVYSINYFYVITEARNSCSFLAPTDSILASVIKTEDGTSRKSGIKDYSIYRTPSGKQSIFPSYDVWNLENTFFVVFFIRFVLPKRNFKALPKHQV